MYNDAPLNHPLIPRDNNVILEKKHVTIHTEDRDTRLKENGETIESQSQFSIQLPEPLENVAYVQLKNIQCPTYFVNIAEKYRNNKLSLAISGGGANGTIVVPDGLYTPTTLMQQLIALTSAEYDFIDTNSTLVGRLLFKGTSQRIKGATLTISFSGLNYTNNNNCASINSDLTHTFENTRRWGLGYILGWDEKTDIDIVYNATGNPDLTTVTLPSFIRLDYLNTMYLEVNDFNTISEIKPDIGNRNNVFNNGYSGLGSAALAKIPIPGQANNIVQAYNLLSLLTPSEFLETRKLFLNSFKTRVHKLFIKFRDHNGALIDFDNQDFTFTLEFGIIRNVPVRDLEIFNKIY